jgi:hypothetical protein
MLLTLKYLLPVLVLAPALGWAQGSLHDPTMPPPGFQVTGKGAAGLEGATGPVVAQSLIRITPVGGGRKQAELGGRTLQPGQSLNAWRVVNITATGVVFKDSRGSRTESMSPDTVRKKLVSGPASEQ